VRAFAAGVAATTILVALSACGGGGSSNYVAKVGSQPITKKQLDAAMDYDRRHYWLATFPRRGNAEYVLLRQQTIDFLVEQSRAHQVDAELGIDPQDRVLTHASYLKVTAGVHVGEGELETYFQQHRNQLGHAHRAMDVGTASSIRSELLGKRRSAVVRDFLADVKRRDPVLYAPGYAPVSTAALGQRIWGRPAHRRCDLPAGSYPFVVARDHGCETPIPGLDAPPCPLIDRSSGDSGFTSAEVDDGYADSLGDNGGSCVPDPRREGVQVDAPPSHEPVRVSYVPRRGSATFYDEDSGLTLRYPRRLHVQRVREGAFDTMWGVAVANYPIDPSAPSSQPLSAGAVDLLFNQVAIFLPERRRTATVTKLPIRISDAQLARGRYTAQVSVYGMSFVLSIRTGTSPSRRDVDALRAIVASIHFPPLRIGHLAPNNLYVLGRASSYPVGAVTEVPSGLPLPSTRKLRSGRFYLEHAADGFWTLSWPKGLEHGYRSCGPQYEANRRRFTCPTGAVWDFEGEVIRNPNPRRYADDPLARTRAVVADGDVLVSLPPPRQGRITRSSEQAPITRAR
jgi:hypothetical protein